MVYPKAYVCNAANLFIEMRLIVHARCLQLWSGIGCLKAFCQGSCPYGTEQGVSLLSAFHPTAH